MNFNKTVYTFLKELDNFDYDLSVTDLVWNLIFPDKDNIWYSVRVTKYRDTYYIYHIDGNNCALEVVLNDFVKPFRPGQYRYYTRI